MQMMARSMWCTSISARGWFSYLCYALLLQLETGSPEFTAFATAVAVSMSPSVLPDQNSERIR